MVFARPLLPSQGFYIGAVTRSACAVNKLTITGLTINHLVTLYREPASIQKALYPDGKNHAVPSLNHDTSLAPLARVPGFYLVPRRVTLTQLYRRAVSVHWQQLTRLFWTSFCITILSRHLDRYMDKLNGIQRTLTQKIKFNNMETATLYNPWIQ